MKSSGFVLKTGFDFSYLMIPTNSTTAVITPADIIIISRDPQAISQDEENNVIGNFYIENQFNPDKVMTIYCD